MSELQERVKRAVAALKACETPEELAIVRKKTHDLHMQTFQAWCENRRACREIGATYRKQAKLLQKP